MRQLLALLLLAVLTPLPAVDTFQISLEVDGVPAPDSKHVVPVASTTNLQCDVSYSQIELYYYDSDLPAMYIRLIHITKSTSTELTSSSVKQNGWKMSVTLTGLDDVTTLRCDLSIKSTSITRLMSAYVTLSPSASLPSPALPSSTHALINMGLTTTSATHKPSFSFGSTYIIYILVIVIFLSTLVTTGAIACWLSARVRGNRLRLQRAHATRVREMQDALASQPDTVVLTHMHATSRQDAPPPYEGATINTTISLHIDSAPPCYQEALSQPPEEQTPPQEAARETEAPPPPFEPDASSRSSNQSLDILSEETDRLIPSADH